MLAPSNTNIWRILIVCRARVTHKLVASKQMSYIQGGNAHYQPLIALYCYTSVDNQAVLCHPLQTPSFLQIRLHRSLLEALHSLLLLWTFTHLNSVLSRTSRMVFLGCLLPALASIIATIVSASNVKATAGENLSARSSPPEFVANKISWDPGDDGDHLFCKWDGSGQVGIDDPDCELKVSDCSFLSLGFQTGFLHPKGTWFQVFRQFTQSVSNLTQIASYGTCSVSIALLNGPSAS